MPSAAVAQENRRKRKAAFEDVDGSPGPSLRHSEFPGSPYRDAKSKTLYAQYEAPAYSIERLFTEKELAMNMNLAAMAATNFMVKLKANGTAPQATTSTDTNGVNGHLNTNLDTEDPVLITEAPDNENDEDATPAAADMDRTGNTSQYTHQTRGATRNALTDLATIAEGRLPFQSPSIPLFVPAVLGSKANGAAPGPPPLTQAEIDQDFAIMSRRDVGGDDALNQRLLEHAVGDQARQEPSWAEYRYQAPSTTLAGGSEKDAEVLSNHLLAGLGGVAMSRQTSQGGMSDAGGAVSMSRTGSAMGGVGLRRTASYRGRAARA